jgi:hypothetical protein
MFGLIGGSNGGSVISDEDELAKVIVRSNPSNAIFLSHRIITHWYLLHL